MVLYGCRERCRSGGVLDDEAVDAAVLRFFHHLVAGGAIPRGLLETPEGYSLWLFTYLDSYEADNGTDTPYMPVDKMLIGSSKARCDRYFGPAEMLPLTPDRIACYEQYFGFSPVAPPLPPTIANMAAVVNPAMFYCDAYVNGNFTAITSRTQTAPIFAPTMVDAFVVLTGLISA